MTAGLTWYPANSADADHDDLEADLCPLGCPGGAIWAWVAGWVARAQAEERELELDLVRLGTDAG